MVTKVAECDDPLLKHEKWLGASPRNVVNVEVDRKGFIDVTHMPTEVQKEYWETVQLCLSSPMVGLAIMVVGNGQIPQAEMKTTLKRWDPTCESRMTLGMLQGNILQEENARRFFNKQTRCGAGDFFVITEAGSLRRSSGYYLNNPELSMAAALTAHRLRTQAPDFANALPQLTIRNKDGVPVIASTLYVLEQAGANGYILPGILEHRHMWEDIKAGLLSGDLLKVSQAVVTVDVAKRTDFMALFEQLPVEGRSRARLVEALVAGATLDEATADRASMSKTTYQLREAGILDSQNRLVSTATRKGVKFTESFESQVQQRALEVYDELAVGGKQVLWMELEDRLKAFAVAAKVNIHHAWAALVDMKKKHQVFQLQLEDGTPITQINQGDRYYQITEKGREELARVAEILEMPFDFPHAKPKVLNTRSPINNEPLQRNEIDPQVLAAIDYYIDASIARKKQ